MYMFNQRTYLFVQLHSWFVKTSFSLFMCCQLKLCGGYVVAGMLWLVRCFKERSRRQCVRVLYYILYLVPILLFQQVCSRSFVVVVMFKNTCNICMSHIYMCKYNLFTTTQTMNVSQSVGKRMLLRAVSYEKLARPLKTTTVTVLCRSSMWIIHLC